jgi:ATP-dependent Lon protease
MKILYPHGGATPEEIEELLAFSMEVRRRVREHILRIDDTFKRHDFVYERMRDGRRVSVVTPEELQYPAFAAPRMQAPAAGDGAEMDELDESEAPSTAPSATPAESVPIAGHVTVPENTKGWSYARLFAPYLRGAARIIVRDPYIRAFFQTRNMMEFLQMVHGLVQDGDEVAVHLVTALDADPASRQEENLNQMVTAFTGSRIAFTWAFDDNPNFHARSITTDTGWKIMLERGLDIFQRFDAGTFSLEQAVQEARLTKGTEVTYLREG